MKRHLVISIFIIFVSLAILINILQVSAGYVDLGEAETTQTVKLSDPLGMEGEEDVPQKLIGKIINAVLGIVGSLALVMFIYGGFTWMLAAGNQEKVKKGKDVIIWAAIGLVIIFSAYALVKFVFSGLGV